jgi:hypothetical protein
MIDPITAEVSTDQDKEIQDLIDLAAQEYIPQSARYAMVNIASRLIETRSARQAKTTGNDLLANKYPHLAKLDEVQQVSQDDCKFYISCGDAILRTVIDCPYDIYPNRIVLYFDTNKPGHNVLDQLSRRLLAVSVVDHCNRCGKPAPSTDCPFITPHQE